MENLMVVGAQDALEAGWADAVSAAENARYAALIALADKPAQTLDSHELCADEGVQAIVAEMLSQRARLALGERVLPVGGYYAEQLLKAALRAMGAAA